jgi:hypothetical protein
MPFATKELAMTDKLPNTGGGDDEQLSNDLQQFAADLSRLLPRDDRLDRERLAFLAGRASVAPSPSKSFKPLGIPLESRAWPTAFAAMTAIAATLLCILLMRPELPGTSSIASDAPVQDGRKVSSERVNGRAVLTISDVHLTDIETLLAKLDANQSLEASSASPNDGITSPVFTPSAWKQVIRETESAKPLRRESSGSPHFQGVNT